MTYGKTSWGYKSGGFGNHTVVKLEHIKLKPEYVISYEGGLKFTTLDNRLIFNTAGFYSKFEDYQTEVWLPTGGLTLPTYTNAATVISKGIEMELIAIPLMNLSLNASVGYIDARYDEFNFEDMEKDFTGNKLELAPIYEYSISAEYMLPVIGIGTFKVRGDYIRKDDYYFDASNSEDVNIPGYELVNAKIGYQSTHNTFGIYLWGKNLSDELYMLTRFIAPLSKTAWYAIPRTFGMGFTYNFL
jgi:iron complex outermembrane receptor protein